MWWGILEDGRSRTLPRLGAGAGEQAIKRLLVISLSNGQKMRSYYCRDDRCGIIRLSPTTSLSPLLDCSARMFHLARTMRRFSKAAASARCDYFRRLHARTTWKNSTMNDAVMPAAACPWIIALGDISHLRWEWFYHAERAHPAVAVPTCRGSRSAVNCGPSLLAGCWQSLVAGSNAFLRQM